jgi:hypothetical protein
MARNFTVKTSSDPRTGNPTSYVPEKEAGRRAVAGYKMGHEDATNQTVKLAKTPEGVAALNALIVGNAKPYRAAQRNERRKIV